MKLEAMQMRIVGSVKQMIRRRQQGMTLIELMVTIAIVAILLTVGIPNMSSYWQSNRLVSGSEAVYSHMQLGRSVALARNQEIHTVFGNTGGTAWCMAISENDSCDCTTTPATNCTLTNMPVPILKGGDYNNVTLSSNFTGNKTSVQMPRGTVSDAGTVTLTSQSTGEVVKVVLSTLGRARICSDDLSQYGGC